MGRRSKDGAAFTTLVAIVAVTVPLLAGGESPPSASGQATGCPANPTHLSPKGGPGSRFTMLIRVNKPENVGDFAALQAAHGQIKTRDIFVINTRFKGSSPGKAREILERLQVVFPCNRAIALNGLGSDPDRPGYALSLIERPELWAVMLDWERSDWGHARATDPGMSRWKRKFKRNINRLGSWVGQLADDLDAAGSGIGKVGVIPSFFDDWHYGRIAGVLDRRNRRFGTRRGGVQVVATQASCKKHKGDLKGMRSTAKDLFHQYGKTRRKKRNLAVQISFSDQARARRYLPIRSVNEGRAASCLRAALRGGAGAVLFWASPESMWDLSQTHRFRKLRHRLR